MLLMTPSRSAASRVPSENVASCALAAIAVTVIWQQSPVNVLAKKMRPGFVTVTRAALNGVAPMLNRAATAFAVLAS
jgi:hypothetical protein